MDPQLEIISSKHLFRGRIVSVREDHLEFREGNRKMWWEVVEHPGAAAILAREGDQIILLRQYRHPVRQILWEIPAGKLEAGEKPLDCARRELAEETGFRGKNWRLLASFYPSPGFCDELIYLYEATGLEAAPAEPDEHEQLEVVRLTLSTALNMVLKGEITDAKTIIALSHFLPAGVGSINRPLGA